MTREEYLELLKSNNDGMILYNFYKEKGGDMELPIFGDSLNKWISFHMVNTYELISRCKNYFNNKFTIVKISNKEGNLIDIR